MVIKGTARTREGELKRMNERLSEKKENPLPNWTDCDFFCIHEYAASGGASCGWRGQRHQIGYDQDGSKLLCPRCRQPTLFPIPLTLRADS